MMTTVNIYYHFKESHEASLKLCNRDKYGEKGVLEQGESFPEANHGAHMLFTLPGVFCLGSSLTFL